MIGSSASERAFQASQSLFTFRHTRRSIDGLFSWETAIRRGAKCRFLAWRRGRSVGPGRADGRSMPACTRRCALAHRCGGAETEDHPDEKTISLLAISVSHLEEHWDVQLELPLGLEDEARRPGTKEGMARWAADCAVDRIRDRFGWDAVGYGSVVLGISRSVPDEFRKLAEKDL
jgi:hypothetical protein